MDFLAYLFSIRANSRAIRLCMSSGVSSKNSFLFSLFFLCKAYLLIHVVAANSSPLKYSKEAVSPEIHITVKKINSENESRLPNNLAKAFYQFDFKDNGIGFEQDYAEKIFLLFNRLHGKTEYAGTGIGLAICKKIVENHQGYIFAEAEVNEGANFTIFLPVIV